MPEASHSYRPHNPGHDYYAPGIYLITLVVREREAVFADDTARLCWLNNDPKAPGVRLTEIGKAVMEEWTKTPAIQKERGNNLTILSQICMPDHWHGVVQVNSRMDKSLGRIIQYVKSSCTARWRAITGTQLVSSSTQAIRSMGIRKRQDYNTTLPRLQQPLFDDDYDDTICLSDPVTGAYDQRHLEAMQRYVIDNPRRAIIRHLRPEFMQRCLHVEIRVAATDGRHITRQYAAFGNLFLLRWTRKVQVFCHRKAPDGRTPYETTEAFRDDCRRWKEQIMAGQTVIVTPGISKGELTIKNRCIESGYPLIHLQKDPIGRYWKPEKSRFDACSQGRLLILAPWKPEEMGEVNGVPSDTDYSVFHNLNKLAEEICQFNGDAVVKG